MTPLSEVTQGVRSYIAGKMDAMSLVNLIDEAVSSDSVYDYPEAQQEIILRYQDLLALFVEDDDERKESSLYYGPDRLKEIVDALYKDLARSNSDHNGL